MMKHRNIQTNWQTKFFLLIALLNAFALLLLSNPTAEAGKMYWTHYRGIDRAERDGGSLETLIPVTLSSPGYIAVDADGGKIYWTDEGTKKIQRANLDGTDIEDIVTTGLSFPSGIAVDVDGGKIYWTDYYYGTRKIQRANLDGTEVEDIVTTGLSWPSGIAVDAEGGKIYWTDLGRDKIQRANLDGTDIEDIVTAGLSRPSGIAVDAVGGKIYWTNGGTNKIQRANLDGTNVEDIVTGLSHPFGIAVNVDGGKIYWTDAGTYPDFVGKIQRANLDGTNIEDIVTTGLTSPYGIAVDAVRGKIYWTGWDKIQRANLDGTNVEDIVTTELTSPYGIAVDAVRRKIYWVDYGKRKIQRANLDGTNIEDIVDIVPTGMITIPSNCGIAVDADGGKIYWTDISADKIQCANLDGTNVEDLVTGLNIHYGIAVDADGGKIYWADSGTDKIQRANLDGTDVEDIVTGLSRPYGIAVDAVGGKIYWTEYDWYSGAGKIQRANLDGTNVEDLVTGLIEPRYIALDLPVTPIAGFSADVTSGYAPLTVQFTDTSIPVTDPITSWSWDFDNDGTIDSYNPNPTHTYAKAGTYTVKLTISDGTLSDDEIKTDYITVEFPIGDVSGDSTVSAYDAALILQFVVGLIDEFPVASMMGGSPENAIPRHYEVSVPSLRAGQGQRINVPIQINDATGFIAGGVSLKYDATVLKAVGASLKLNGAYWQANTELDGEVRVAFASVAKTEFSHSKEAKTKFLHSKTAKTEFLRSESQTLFVVEFDVLADTEGKISPLILDRVQLAESLSIKKINGLVTVLPSEFRLHQNYPNPFNPETWIPYDLATDASVEITIYDAQGHQIRTLTLGAQPAGSYLTMDRATRWDGRSDTGELVSSGIYFYHLRAGDFHGTKRMIILK